MNAAEDPHGVARAGWFVPVLRDGAPLLPHAGAGVAFVAAIAGAIALTLTRARAWLSPWEEGALGALAACMIVLALAWRSRARAALFGYWSFQVAAAVVLTVASRGHGALALLAVLGQTALLMPRSGVASVAIALGAVAVSATRLRAGSWPEALGSAAGHLAGLVFVVAFMEILVRERHARRESERLVAELATRRERLRIAREVHDILGHTLTAVHAQLSGAAALLDHDRERSVALMNGARALTEQGLVDVRRSVAFMRDEARSPLLDEVRSLVTTTRASGVGATLAVHGQPPPSLSPEISLALARAAQECVTNSLRHARASKIVLTLAFKGRIADLRVEDDGVGAAAIVPGAGLRGVQERIALLGGNVSIESHVGKGTRVDARVPLSSDATPAR